MEKRAAAASHTHAFSRPEREAFVRRDPGSLRMRKHKRPLRRYAVWIPDHDARELFALVRNDAVWVARKWEHAQTTSWNSAELTLCR